MDKNKNNEMSVDELLEKLRESLQAEDDEKKPTDAVDDEDIKKVVAAAIDINDDATEPTEETLMADEDAVEVEAPEAELFEEPFDVEEDDMAATIEMSVPVNDEEVEAEAEAEAETEAAPEAEAEIPAETTPEPAEETPVSDEEPDSLPDPEEELPEGAIDFTAVTDG